MNYNEVLSYLYSSLPVFHRIGPAALKPGLQNTLELLRLLGNPELKFKTIHIAGTNGKGSSSHMLAAVLQMAGYKTGLYTSPHLKSFTERIRVNGKEVEEDYVVDFVAKNKHHIEYIRPSFFEVTVGMAFDYFSKSEIDIAIIETGLGGRLDSTNVITPLISLITNISYDHQSILGETLPQIASEKAGIIKTHVPVVVSETQEEVRKVFEEKAKQLGSEIYFADQIYQVKAKQPLTQMLQLDIVKDNQVYLKNLYLSLAGDYQKKNIGGVLEVLSLLTSMNFSIQEQHIRKGLGAVNQITGLKGRWQQLNRHPLTICDTGHNKAGVQYIVEQIRKIGFAHLYWVFGVVNDKEIEPILAILPKEAHYIFCQADIPRAMEAERLYQKALALGLKGEVVTNVNEAYFVAKQKATYDDLIMIGGSTFVVAELDEL